MPANPGLCGECAHMRAVDSARGSRFVLCDRAKDDPRFPKYPRLPVLVCPGFAASEAAVDPPQGR